MHQPVVIGALLGAAVALALVCSLGVAVMRDPLQRLQFATPVVSFSALFIAVAVWLDDEDAQARIKVILIGGILFLMNAILTHATARAARIQRLGYWAPRPEEQIRIVGRDGVAGAQQEEHSQ